MKILTTSLLLAVCAMLPTAHAAGSGLENLLSARVAEFPGKLTLYVKHLTTGEEVSVKGDEPMSSMSVVKLGILAQAYQMSEQGKLNLESRVTLDSKDYRGGSGIFQYHTPGLNPTLSDLLLQMVITSDNTATDALLARTGGVDGLNRWFAGNGVAEMRMHGTIASYFAQMSAIVAPKQAQGLSEPELNAVIVDRRRDELTPAVRELAAELGKYETWMGLCDRFKTSNTWLGSTTARATGRLLEQMETAKIVSKPKSAEMMDMLKSQQAGARRIPMYLDTQYAIGHKTGDFPPCVANDVGVVYLRSGPTVMVFLSDQISGNYGEAEEKIGAMARLVANYFDGVRGRV